MSDDGTGTFEFRTNLDEVAQQVADRLGQIVSEVESTGSKLGKIGGSGGLSTNSILSGYETGISALAKNGLEDLRKVSEKFAEAGKQGSSKVNGQTITQAYKQVFDSLDKSFTSYFENALKGAPQEARGDLGIILSKGLSEVRAYYAKLVTNDLNQLNLDANTRIGKDVNPFGRGVSNTKSALALSSGENNFAAEADAVRKFFKDVQDAGNKFTVDDRKNLRNSANNVAQSPFPNFAYRDAEGNALVQHPDADRVLAVPKGSRSPDAILGSNTDVLTRLSQLLTTAPSLGPATSQAPPDVQALLKAIREFIPQVERLLAAGGSGRPFQIETLGKIGKDGARVDLRGVSVMLDGLAKITAKGDRNGAVAPDAFNAAVQKLVTFRDQVGEIHDPGGIGKELAQTIRDGLRSGDFVQTGKNQFANVNSGEFFQSSGNIKSKYTTASPAGPQAESDYFDSMDRRAQTSKKARAQEEEFLAEEKTAYDEFLKGFFGAGGRKRTGGASEIDASNPLAGFAETAGIVAKYELQGRAIQSLSGVVAGAVGGYAKLDEAVRQYNNVVGDSNGATHAYIASLENLTAVAGGNVVEALQTATRGVAVFSAANASADAKRTVGKQVVTEATKVGVITGQNQQTSTDQIIGAAQAYGLGADQLNKVTDAIAYAKEEFGASGAVIGKTLSDLGAQGKQAGFSLNEFAAITGKLAAKDSTGNLTNDLGRLLEQFTTGKGKTELAQVGVNVSGNAKSELVSLSKVWSTLSGIQQDNLGVTLGGAKALKDLLPLLEAGGGLTEILANSTKAAGAGNREYNASVSSIAGQLRQVSTELKNLGLDLARSGILTPLGALVEVLKVLVGVADKGAQAFDAFAGPFKAFGIGAKDAAITGLELLAVIKLITAAQARLAAGEAGGGLTGVSARIIGYNRVRRGRDLETNRTLTPEAADAQRKENGIRPRQAAEQKATESTTALAEANTAAASGITTATEARIVAEERLIAVLNGSATAQGAATAEEVAADEAAAAAAAALAEAEATAAAALRFAAVGARDAGLLSRAASSTAGVRTLAGGALRATGIPRAVNSDFVGGPGRLAIAGIIGAIGFEAIKSASSGTSNQLKAQGRIQAASTDENGANVDSDAIRKQADKLSGAVANLDSAASGLRGGVTKIVNSLQGDDSGQGSKRSAKGEAATLNALADKVDKQLKTAAQSGSGNGLADNVNFGSLDQFNTSLTNLSNSGASGVEVFNALDTALKRTLDNANGLSTKLDSTQRTIVSDTVGAHSQNEVSVLHDLFQDKTNHLTGNRTQVSPIDAIDPKDATKARHILSGNNKEVGDTVSKTIDQFLTDNPTFDPKNTKGEDAQVTELNAAIKAALGRTKGLTGNDKVTKALIDALANNASYQLSQTTAPGLGKEGELPQDFGKNLAAAIATNSGAASSAAGTYALTGKTSLGVSATDGGHADSQELYGAKVKLATDRKLLDQAKKSKVKGKNIGAAIDAVNQDEIAFNAAMLSFLQQIQSTNALSISITDKVGQDESAITALAGEIASQPEGVIKNFLRGQKDQQEQQLILDKVGATNAVADSGLQSGNSLAAAQGAAADAQRTLEGYQAVAAKHPSANASADVANALKARNDANYEVGVASVAAQAAAITAAVDPRNVQASIAAQISAAQLQLNASNDPATRSGLAGQILQLQVQAIQDAAATQGAQAEAAVDPRDEVGAARAKIVAAQASLNASGGVGAAFYQAITALNEAKLALAQAEVARANAQEAAGVFPGDALRAAAVKFDSAKRSLAADLPGTLQYFTDLGALRQTFLDYANAIAENSLTATKVGQDLTNPVIVAQDAVKQAQNKLDLDKFFKAPSSVTNADKVNLKQAASSAEQAAFEQRLKFTDTDLQLYRITLPQYLAKLRSLRAAIKGNTVQAINDRNEIDQKILSAEQAGGGQFNIGDIKLPTIYEARRQGILHGQVTEKSLKDAGQAALNAGEGFNNVFQPITDALGQIQTRGAVLELTSLQQAIGAITAGPSGAKGGTSTSHTTNHVSISGADFAKVVAYLSQVLGVAATSTRTSLSTRKV